MLQLWLMGRRWFWKVRTAFAASSLTLSWWRYLLARRGREQRAETGVLGSLLFHALAGLPIGVAIIVIFRSLAFAGQGAIDVLPHGVARNLVRWMITPAETSIVDLLTLVPAVSGVVLGLYFAGIATLFQSRYGRVPAQVRALVTEDRVGRTYVGLLSTAIATSVLWLIVEVTGARLTRLDAVAVGLIGLSAFLGFAAFGRRAFDFLDPVRLIDPVVSELLSSTRAASVASLRSHAREYEALHQSDATRAIDTLDVLFGLARTDEQQRNEPLERVARMVPLLVRNYLAVKSSIPAGSAWFERFAKHPRWFLSGSAMLDVATNMRVALPPEEGINRFWYEERLLSLLEKSIEDAIARRQWELLARLLLIVSETCSVLGYAWTIGSAHDWLKRVGGSVLVSVREATDHASPRDVEWLHHAADLVALSRISVLLGFRQRVLELEAVDFAASIQSIRWNDYRSIEKVPGAFALSSELEDMQSRVRFETEVYGRRVTPAWYVAEELARHLVVRLQITVDELFKIIAESLARSMTGLSQPAILIEAALASRSMEQASRLVDVVPRVEELHQKLTAAQASGYLRWPKWDFAALRSSARRNFESRAEALAANIPALATLPSDERMVDYVGEAVSLTGEECYQALFNGEDDHFAKLFGPYFTGCLHACDRLAEKSRDWDAETFTVIWSEPLMDLYAISGYSLLYSLMRGKSGPWKQVRSTWDSYLRNKPDKLEVLRSAFEVHGPLTKLRPRALMRSRWDQHFGGQLAPLNQSPLGSPFSRSIRHRRRILRAVARVPFVDGEEVFAALYLWRGEPIDKRPGHFIDQVARLSRSAPGDRDSGPEDQPDIEVGDDES